MKHSSLVDAIHIHCFGAFSMTFSLVQRSEAIFIRNATIYAWEKKNQVKAKKGMINLNRWWKIQWKKALLRSQGTNFEEKNYGTTVLQRPRHYPYN